MRSLPVRPEWDLADLGPGRHLAAVGVSDHGRVYALSADRPVGHGRAGARPFDYRIHVRTHAGLAWRPGRTASVDLPPTTRVLRHLQFLGYGRWLAVGFRARAATERNARAYGPAPAPAPATATTEGAAGAPGIPDATPALVQEAAFPAGDYVGHVRAVAPDRIWVGYEDRGVLGTEDPRSTCGLVCLDAAGLVRADWRDLAAGHRLPPFYECYGLNAASARDLWLWYYTSPDGLPPFTDAGHPPLVYLRDGRLAGVWRGLPLGPGHAVAVWGQRALIAGHGYPVRTLAWTLVDLATGAREAVRPATPDGAPVAWERPFAKGSCLYGWDGSRLLAYDLRRLERPRPPVGHRPMSPRSGRPRGAGCGRTDAGSGGASDSRPAGYGARW